MQTQPIPKITSRTIQAHLNTKQLDLYHYLDKTFAINSGMFNPNIAASGIIGRMFCSLPIFQAQDFLEIGSGAGIWCCLVKLAGANKVIGLDTNSRALATACHNAKMNGLGKQARFLNQDIKSWKTKQKFDIIYADLPFVDAKSTSTLEYSFLDDGLSGIKYTIIHSSALLKPKGSLYLCLANISPIFEIRTLAKQVGWGWETLIQVRHQGIKLYLVKLTL